MSKVKSFRFSDETLILLAKLEERTKTGQREIIEAAIEKLFDNWNNLDEDIVIDFHDNLFGINNPRVEIFMESLESAGYIIYYGNGDRVLIRKKE